jgi:hypothetical protein
VRLERELFEANEKILEAQQERLAAMRRAKEVSAATHAANQQRQNKCVCEVVWQLRAHAVSRDGCRGEH